MGKVDNPYLVKFLIMTPTLESYVIWSGSKNGYQKDMCSKEIGLRAQSMITSLGAISQHNWGYLYDHLMSMRISLRMSKIFICAPKIMKVATASIWIC
jgi:hypothetical protein